MVGQSQATRAPSLWIAIVLPMVLLVIVAVAIHWDLKSPGAFPESGILILSYTYVLIYVFRHSAVFYYLLPVLVYVVLYILEMNGRITLEEEALMAAFAMAAYIPTASWISRRNSVAD